jgi:hypothetical protein
MMIPSTASNRPVLITVLLLIIGFCLAVIVLRPSGRAVAGAQAQGNCTTFPETGQTVCGRFLEYWRANGGLPQFGYPISPEFTEKSELNGKDHVVQYFERAVFEYHPENRPPYNVLLSQLGTYRFTQKYPHGAPIKYPAGSPTAAAVVTRTAIPAEKGVEVSVGQGVVTTLIDQVQTAITGVRTGNCGTEMTWVVQTTNRGTAPFVVDLDKTSLRMIDSTGKSYALSPDCFGPPYSGSFSSPITIAPGEIHKGYVAFRATDIPQSAAYVDFYMVLSGTPVAFRYMLP